jgi:hypothetical protein
LIKIDPHQELPEEIRVILRRQYQESLETLRETMKNPDRERDVVWAQLSDLQTSGIPDPEHVPTLIELERVTREVGGTAYMEVDKAVFDELDRIIRPETIPLDFLLEVFQYCRRYDNFARRRRARAVNLAATIAAQTGDVEAVGVLVEMLSDPRADVHEEVIVTLYKTYEWQGVEMPQVLVDRLRDMARNDTQQVREIALAVLQQVGQISIHKRRS